MVDIKDACFTPNVLRVQPGQNVTFLNADPMPHTVTGVADSWGSNEELAEGQKVTYRFQTSGVFPYFCWVHPGMAAVVVVGDGTSSKTTTQDVVPVAPPAAPATSAPVVGQPAAEAPASTPETSNAWRVAMVLAVLALISVGGALAMRMLGRRRAAVRA
jgi:hypothetical protein